MMSRISITSAVALLVLLGSVAAAQTTSDPCGQVGSITSIERDEAGVVTANVSGRVTDFFPLGQTSQISVSGVADLGSHYSFNGGPFTALVTADGTSYQFVWQTTVLHDAVQSGNGSIFPALGSPNLVVQFSGNSAQFSVAPASDPSKGYTFSYGSMAELDFKTGSIVKGHKVNININNNSDSGWSPPYNNGAYTLVRFCDAFTVADRFVPIEADHFIYPTAATIEDGLATMDVSPDSVKFNLDIREWPFISCDPPLCNTLQVQMRIKVPSQIDIDEVDIQRSAGSITQITIALRQGPGLQISFPTAVNIDNANVEILDPGTGSPTGYSVDAKVSDTGIELFLNFPRATSEIKWDPVIRLVQ